MRESSLENFNGEVWLDVVEFPTHYRVSNYGRLFSKVRNKILSPQVHKTKLWRVRLCVNYIKYSRSVHRLVAQAFIPNPDNKPEVNHKDGNRLNNCLSNLEWVTKVENMKHAVETKLINNLFGEQSRNFKGTTICIDMEGKIVGKYNGNKELLAAGFCYKQVSAVIRGKQKTHKGYFFKRGD